MKNSEKGIFDPGGLRNLPIRLEGSARGGGEIRPRAKEKEQTRENRKGNGAILKHWLKVIK